MDWFNWFFRTPNRPRDRIPGHCCPDRDRPFLGNVSGSQTQGNRNFQKKQFLFRQRFLNENQHEGNLIQKNT